VISEAVAPLACAIEEKFRAAPLAFAEPVLADLKDAATALNLAWTVMPSGAFHDAQLVARAAPSAMIFVPCHKGISHNPAEFTSSAQLAAGTRALALALALQGKSRSSKILSIS
jgi:N-carbamoyl-L-amino-acid hydrolase